MNIGKCVTDGSCAHKVCPVDTPLIGERRAASRGHREKRVRSGDDGLALRLAGDGRRRVDREQCIGAGDGTGGICDHHGIIARVGGLHVAARVTGRSRTTDVGAIETPLVIQRRRSGRADTERHAGAGIDRLVRGLGGDGRRQSGRKSGREINVGLARTHADGIGEAGRGECIVLQTRVDGVTARRQTHEIVGAVAVDVGHSRCRDVDARALQRRSVGLRDTPTDPISRRRANGDHH